MCNNKYGLPKIAAVDFDGTLVSDMFPGIGDINQKMFDTCKQLQQQGVKLILWTSRDNDTEDKHLDAAIQFCREHGLEFDAINQNIPEVIEKFHNDTRKVYADVYIDDKAVVAYQDPLWWRHRLLV